MTLRIFDESDAIEAVFALHGWLSAAEVNEVERLAAECDRPLRLDLAHLVGVDAEGASHAASAAAAGSAHHRRLALRRAAAGADGRTGKVTIGGKR